MRHELRQTSSSQAVGNQWMQGATRPGTPRVNGSQHARILSLPLELRVEIIKHCFGVNQTHLGRHGEDSRLLHYKYIANSDSVAARWSLDNEGELYVRSMNFITLHEYCGPRAQHLDRRTEDPMNSALLCVNKQLRLEANQVLFNTQIFLIETYRWTLVRLCQQLISQQITSLRRIELMGVVDQHCNELEAQKEPRSSEEALQALEQLHDLNLHIYDHTAKSFYCPFQGRRIATQEEMRFLHTRLRAGFGGLRALPNLKKVSVHTYRITYTNMQKEDFAVINRKFEAELLSPLGSDFVNQEKIEQGWSIEIKSLNATIDAKNRLLSPVRLRSRLLQGKMHKLQNRIATIERAHENLAERFSGPGEDARRRYLDKRARLEQMSAQLEEISQEVREGDAAISLIQTERQALQEKLDDSRALAFGYLDEYVKTQDGDRQ